MRMVIVAMGLAAVAQVSVLPRATAPAKDYPVRAVPLTSVRITDGFWAPKREINRTVTIPHIMQQNEVTGRIENFRLRSRAESANKQRAQTTNP
jgi:uncharacterized protein